MCDPYAYFDFILIHIWFKQCVPKYSTDKVTQFKVREKQAEVPHMFYVKFNWNADEGVS